jgi:hypothetical protein
LAFIYENSYNDIIRNLVQLCEINYIDEENFRKIEEKYFNKNNIIKQARLYYLNWLYDMKAERYELTIDFSKY